MGNVQTTLAGEQEFAADRGHGIVEIDGHAAGEQDFGGHQAGRTAADHDRHGGGYNHLALRKR